MQVFNGNQDQIFNVLETAMPQLEKNIARLNKKAASWGLTLITLTVHGDHMEEVELKNRSFVNGRPQLVGRKVMECSIEGYIPKMNGWTMVAACEITPAGNIIRTVPGWPNDVTIPETFRTRRYCDHCAAARPKKDTFLLMNEDGAWIQVGRNCLADFMGADAANAVDYWTICQKLMEELYSNKTYMTGSERDYSMSLTEIMVATLRVVAGMGYTSNTKAYETGMIATSTHVNHLIHGGSPDTMAYLEEKCPPMANEEEDVAAAIEWAKGVNTTESDYLHNISIIANCGYVSPKSFGLAVSILCAHRRAIQVKPTPAVVVAHVSEFVGKVKERLELGVVKVLRTNPIASDWGRCTVVSFEDKDGNQMVWFASGSPDVAEGGIYAACTATVKEHKVFHGTKQTAVKNAKFGTLVG